MAMYPKVHGAWIALLRGRRSLRSDARKVEKRDKACRVIRTPTDAQRYNHVQIDVLRSSSATTIGADGPLLNVRDRTHRLSNNGFPRGRGSVKMASFFANIQAGVNPRANGIAKQWILLTIRG
jgi:hypothetical protein